jgi:dipeptide/tripeptide permease
VYTGFNVVGTLLFSLVSGKLIDGWLGYRATDCLGALVVAAGVGVIASSTIYELTLVGGFVVGCGTGLATSAQMALNSRVLSKNDKDEDVSNAKDMGMMSNNTNLAQILATSVNGFLLDYFKECVLTSPLLVGMCWGWLLTRQCVVSCGCRHTDVSPTASERATWPCTAWP